MYFNIDNIGCSGKRTFEIPSAVCAQLKIQCPISQRDRFDSINFIPGLCLAFSNSLLDSMSLVLAKVTRYLGPHCNPLQKHYRVELLTGRSLQSLQGMCLKSTTFFYSVYIFSPVLLTYKLLLQFLYCVQEPANSYYRV